MMRIRYPSFLAWACDFPAHNLIHFYLVDFRDGRIFSHAGYLVSSQLFGFNTCIQSGVEFSIRLGWIFGIGPSTKAGYPAKGQTINWSKAIDI